MGDYYLLKKHNDTASKCIKLLKDYNDFTIGGYYHLYRAGRNNNQGEVDEVAKLVYKTKYLLVFKMKRYKYCISRNEVLASEIEITEVKQ